MAVQSNRIFLPGNRFVVAYLAFISAFAPLATDMYLPALPAISQSLNVDNALASYTLSSFLFVFAFSMLVWGPLSDKYGRKPVLVCGSIVFILSSMAIAMSQSFWPLFFWRLAQAAGSGSASAMSLAIVRDILRGRLMEKVISSMQAASILAPMLAPVIGGGLLMLTSWRGIFWCLCICGLIALGGALCLRETCIKKADLSLAGIFKRMGGTLKNRNFRRLLLLFSMMAMPFMSYLAVSTFIFQDTFALSAQAFSIFFAFNAGVSLFGPLTHIFVFRHFNARLCIAWQMAIMVLAGLGVLLAGTAGPWTFALLFLPVTFCGSAIRPPSTVLTMQSIKGDNGIVASLINCGGLVCGSLSMSIATLGFWPNPIMAVGGIAFTVSALCLVAWVYIIKKGES